jgi:hypothetical protein
MEHQSDSLDPQVYAFSGGINSVQPRRQSWPDSATSHGFARWRVRLLMKQGAHVQQVAEEADGTYSFYCPAVIPLMIFSENSA